MYKKQPVPKDLVDRITSVIPEFPEQAVIFQGQKTGLEYVIKFWLRTIDDRQINYYIGVYLRGTVDESIDVYSDIDKNYDKNWVGQCMGWYYKGNFLEKSVVIPSGEIFAGLHWPQTLVHRVDVKPPHDNQGLGTRLVQLLYDALPAQTKVVAKSETLLAATKIRRIFEKVGFVEKDFVSRIATRGVYIIEWER